MPNEVNPRKMEGLALELYGLSYYVVPQFQIARQCCSEQAAGYSPHSCRDELRVFTGTGSPIRSEHGDGTKNKTWCTRDDRNVLISRTSAFET